MSIIYKDGTYYGVGGGGGGAAGTFAPYTLLATGWVLNSNTGHYEYSLENDYPTNHYNLMVATCSDMDISTYNQAYNACMVGDINTNKIVCLGTKPTANIPVMLYILEK